MVWPCPGRWIAAGLIFCFVELTRSMSSAYLLVHLTKRKSKPFHFFLKKTFFYIVDEICRSLPQATQTPDELSLLSPLTRVFGFAAATTAATAAKPTATIAIAAVASPSLLNHLGLFPESLTPHVLPHLPHFKSKAFLWKMVHRSVPFIFHRP